MNNLLYPVSKEDFKKLVDIRFDNINEGFNNFKSAMLESETLEEAEKNITKFMEEAIILNGEDNSYVDLYFSTLEKEDKERLIGLLEKKDKEIMERIKEILQEDTIYFRLTREIIPFITRLSTREALFCTVYFTNYPITIWGNYNKKFPCFYRDDKILDLYNDIAKECNVEIIV
ncbi:hypothetical protein GCM10008908_20430 [Clostridium subterminale]|uniref:DUF2313 domain-containing protein n=1 Tax=Clostridium subterminale TaxID=1550 RepID=A0ABP3W379_CLOSU